MFNKFADLFQYGQPKNGILELPRLSKSESDSLHHYLSNFFKGLQSKDKNDVAPLMRTIYCTKKGISYFIPTKKGEIQIVVGKRKYTRNTNTSLKST